MGCDNIPYSVRYMERVQNADKISWRGGRAVDKFAGSKFGQTSTARLAPKG